MKTQITPSNFAVAIFEQLKTSRSDPGFRFIKKTLFFLIFFTLNFNAQVPWILQSTNLPPGYTSISNLCLVDNNNLWVYSNNEPLSKMGFSKTANGTTWTIAGELIYGSDLSLTGFQAISGDTAFSLFANTIDYASGVLKKTTDGGNSWVNVKSLSAFPNFVHFFDPNNGIVVCDPNTSISNFVIYKTTDGGINWNVIPLANMPAVVDSEYGLIWAFDYKQNSLWFNTSKGRFFKTDNQGSSWSAVQSPYNWGYQNFASSLGSYFSLENDNTAYILNGNASTASQTVDGGTTWITLGSPNTGNQSFIKKIPNENTLITTGPSSSKYSTDSGFGWVIMDSNEKMYLNSNGSNFTWAIGNSNGLLPTDMALYKLNPSILNVENDKNKNRWQIFPNPAQDYLFISKGKKQPTTYHIIDSSGKKIISGNLSADGKIKISTLSKGIYFIELSGKTESLILKFLKN